MANIVVKTYDIRKKKYVVAGFIHNSIFYRKVQNRHFMVKHNGYGIQIDVLSTCIKHNVKSIVLTTPKNTMLFSLPSDWVNKGKVGDYNHGKQIFLDVKLMKVNYLKGN